MDDKYKSQGRNMSQSAAALASNDNLMRHAALDNYLLRRNSNDIIVNNGRSLSPLERLHKQYEDEAARVLARRQNLISSRHQS